ncbi:PREDICTED: uncharacterized protein LOC104603404, partial [Nelumbo nucifera]|uniref:Uncharacterized protein LOC104603404 n=1 Tax=Nelumbo nucifera TaxID=4432 RepID=A0A1U8Q8B7_NELNU
YVSGDFKAGGYNWKLILYPNGKKERNVKDHISLYLAISEPSSLPVGWQANVMFKLLSVYSSGNSYQASAFILLCCFQVIVKDNVEERKGTKRAPSRFHAMMTKRGFTHLISLETFNDPSNGYLVEDTCYFGAEVFVSKNHGEGECLSMTKGPVSCSHTWKIEKFSLLCEKQYSKEFSVADFPWKILLYPRGDSKEKDRSLSLYLTFADSASLPLGKKVYLDLVFGSRIRSVIYIGTIKCNVVYGSEKLLSRVQTCLSQIIHGAFLWQLGVV